MQYSYTTIRPKPNSVALWEVDLPIGHRLVLKKRLDHLLPKNNPRRVTYQLRCTCGGYRHDNWLRPPMTKLQRLFVVEHISEVRKQGAFEL